MLKIISGGQTGVDRGALEAALELGAECGGWCPAGRLAEDGRIPERYPLVEISTTDYAARTAQNVAEADGTLVICDGTLMGGTRETLRLCLAQSKPHLVIITGGSSDNSRVSSIEQFITENRIRVLNVAGPRASQWPAGHEVAHTLIAAVLCRLSGHTSAVE